jgi:hypothetical protein
MSLYDESSSSDLYGDREPIPISPRRRTSPAAPASQPNQQTVDPAAALTTAVEAVASPVSLVTEAVQDKSFLPWPIALIGSLVVLGLIFSSMEEK